MGGCATVAFYFFCHFFSNPVKVQAELLVTGKGTSNNFLHFDRIFPTILTGNTTGV